MALDLIATLFAVLFFLFAGKACSQTKVFDLTLFGAVEGGTADSSQALLDAWNQACGFSGKNVILVPQGTFLLNPTMLVGPCRGRMQLQIEGTLSASTATSSLNVDHWISIRYVDGLIITGNGVLDGQGNSAWKYNDCSSNPRCITLPTTLRLDFVNNAWIHDIASLNSKNAHLNIFSCQNVTLEHIEVTAPEESPNTDGIKIAMSSDIYIEDSYIGTGDDCIALLPGSKRITVNNVVCGPGHGISIGSLGGSPDEKPITSVWVGNCSFKGTNNGMRIKTKAPSYKGLVSDITFTDIRVDNVANPILIEQQYCPSKRCNAKEVSLVAIRNVKYRNIRGSSDSQVAINLQCSPVVPCLNIELQDIELSYYQRDGDTTSSCANVYGSSLGKQHPSPCVNHHFDSLDYFWH